MKKVRLLFVLAAAALLAIAGTGCSARARKMYHLERADRWFDSGQFDKAEIEYLKVLRADQQDARACSRLGLIYYDEGRFQKAAPFLFGSSQLESTNLDARLKLGQIYLAIGDLKEAHDDAEFVLQRNPQDPEAPVLFAQSVAKQTDIDAARRRLRALIQTGDDAALETALGLLDSQESDFKTALGDFQRALALDSHFAAAYVAAGNLLWQLNELRKAEVAFKAGSDCAPADSPLQIEFGRFEIRAGNFVSAENFFTGLTRKNPGYIPAWLGLAEAALDEKKFNDCAVAVKQILDRDPDNVDGQALDARLALARSDTAGATAALERLARLNPQAPRIHYQLALAYLARHQDDKAAGQLRDAVDLDPRFVEASFLLAQLEMRAGKLDSALDLLKNIVARQPNLIQPKLLVADTYRLKGDFSDAQDIFQQLEKSFPKDPQIPLLSGSTYVQQLNKDAARQEFNRALEIEPDNESAQESLAQLDLADRQFTAAQDHVEKVIQKNPREASPEILLAKIFLAQGQTNQAESALLKATALPGGLAANLLLAQLYFNAKEDQQALDLLNGALAENPTNTSLLMFAGVIQNDQKNYRAAADSYEKLLAINPQYSPALNNLAWLYCDKLGDLDKAYELAQRASQLLPRDLPAAGTLYNSLAWVSGDSRFASTADTLGWILFKKGQYVSALKLFRESAAALPGDPDVQFHLGMAHYMLGDADASREALQSALNSNTQFPERGQCQDCLNILKIHPQTANASTCAFLERRISEKPDDPVALARLAAIYQRDNSAGKTMALCQAVLKASPQNVKAMILLAQLCASSDLQKAYALAKTAYQLNPEDTQVCATLGRLVGQNGNDQWAFSLLEEASQEQPDNAQTLFDLANAAFCIGKISDAQTDMQNALQIGLPATQSAEAKNFLDIVAACQDPSQARAEASQIQELLSSNPGSAPGLFAKALIDSQNRDAVAAQRDYGKLLASHPDCVIAQKNLAILYAQSFVDPAKAYPLAVKAREAFPDDPAVARALAMILFRRGDYPGAADLFNTISDSTAADAWVFYGLGISDFHLKNYSESKTALQRALNLNLSGREATDARETLAELK